MAIELDRLPDIDFAVKDPLTIEAEVLYDYEIRFRALTQIAKQLGPGDPTRLLLLVGSYWIIHDRVDIDFTGKMNLLKYARGPYLDNLLALYGERTLRLEPAKATTLLRFTLPQALPFSALVPLGTHATSDGVIIFETTSGGQIPEGELMVDVPAVSLTPGLEVNGIAVGRISTLVDWNQPWAVTVQNIEPTTGGSEVEDDEHLRDRGWRAPESMSTCGPVGGYDFWGRSAHPDIIDVGVYSALDISGEVHLFPLLRGGELPTPDILEAVLAKCNDDIRRPVTDYVFVQAPTVHEFELEIWYWIWDYDQVIASEIQHRVDVAVRDWLLWTRSAVGRDIIPSDLVRRVQEAGVKRVEVMREVHPSGTEPEPGVGDVVRRTRPPQPRLEPGMAFPPGDIPPLWQPNLVEFSPPFTRVAFNEVAILKGDPIVNFGGLENHERRE